jgi:glycosyltransferase involved in cell wall biosynthesis
MTIHHLAHPRQRLLPNQVRDIGRLRRALRTIGPDLVHSQNPSGALAASAEGLPCVLTIHGIPDQERRFVKGVNGRLGIALAPYLTRRALRRVDAGIAISRYVIEYYRRAAEVNWHSVFNPVEDRFFDIPDGESRGKLLFAGMLYERKNVPGLIRAFALVAQRNQEAELFICGKVLDADIPAWAERYIRDHGLQNRVHLLGFVSQDELARHFREASLICLFSEEETAPMIIAQAMCAGKPVVSTAAGGVPHLMVDGETGFVVPNGDEEAFAARALQLLNDDNLRRLMSSRGRVLAEERFRTGMVVEQTLAVYRQVLASRSR